MEIPRKQACRRPRCMRQTRPARDRCGFALRLTAEKRHAIRNAADRRSASKFARNLLVAAANKDDAAVRAIMKEIAAVA